MLLKTNSTHFNVFLIGDLDGQSEKIAYELNQINSYRNVIVHTDYPDSRKQESKEIAWNADALILVHSPKLDNFIYGPWLGQLRTVQLPTVICTSDLNKDFWQPSCAIESFDKKQQAKEISNNFDILLQLVFTQDQKTDVNFLKAAYRTTLELTRNINRPPQNNDNLLVNARVERRRRLSEAYSKNKLFGPVFKKIQADLYVPAA
jgi:hypothetical protein